jgi:hypothetical protein
VNQHLGRRHEPEDMYFSEPELCQRLQYSRSTVARLRKRGLPSVGRDRLRRYHWPTVLKWLSERA